MGVTTIRLDLRCAWRAGELKVGRCMVRLTISVSRPLKTKSTFTTLHATMLHLLGFDHEKLTYRYAGRDFRLTDVYGRVVRDIIA